jgi:hypothetical protein
MKPLLRFAVILTLLGLNHCASNSELLNNYSNLLTFSHQGEEYNILGFSPQETEGYNLLTKKDQNEILLKCIDKQQDGVLDEVLIGNISLEEANTIYQEAISTASANGSLKQKYFEHYYLTSDKENTFELRTYVLVDGETYNVFAVKPINKDYSYVLRDLQADGSLDYFEEGEGDLILFQSYYDKVVRKGITRDKINFSDGMYYVRK